MGSYHARLLAHRIPGARVCAVADADADAAARLAQELEVPAYTDMQQALDHSGAGALVIATPSGTHALWLSEGARRGLALFCEKPLATDGEEAERALRVVAEAGVALQLGFQRRFDRGFEALRRRVADGRLGRAVMVKTTSRDPEMSPIAYLRGSGGIFQDQMIHDIDMLRYLSGQEIVEVYAAGGAYFAPEIEAFGDVDTAALVVRFADGAMGVADATRQSGYGHDIAAEVFGTRATARLDSAAFEPVTDFAPAGATSRLPTWFLDRFAEAYARELEAFVGVARGEQPPRAGGVDGLMAMRVAAAATRSLASGRPEAVDMNRARVATGEGAGA